MDCLGIEARLWMRKVLEAEAEAASAPPPSKTLNGRRCV